MSLRVLHIASENFAGVPFSLVRAERLLGFESHLLTLIDPGRGHPEEESLRLPLARGFLPAFARRLSRSTAPFGNTRYRGSERPPTWRPPTWGKALFWARDRIWEVILRSRGIPKILDDYDVIVLDGGVGLLRSGKFVLRWSESRGRLVSIFYGDDLRRRGVIPQIERASKLVFTFEFDHTLIHPRAKFLFYPFFVSDMPQRTRRDDGKIRIGHSPTNRASKGTEAILRAAREVARRHKNVEIVLIEGLPYHEALRMKAEVDIFVDQIGELGYGISALEALAMGIPVVVQIMPDFERFLGRHPFVNADERSLVRVLSELVESEDMRAHYGGMGREWVERVHDPARCAETIAKQYRELGWL